MYSSNRLTLTVILRMQLLLNLIPTLSVVSYAYALKTDTTSKQESDPVSDLNQSVTSSAAQESDKHNDYNQNLDLSMQGLNLIDVQKKDTNFKRQVNSNIRQTISSVNQKNSNQQQVQKNTNRRPQTPTVDIVGASSTVKQSQTQTQSEITLKRRINVQNIKTSSDRTQNHTQSQTVTNQNYQNFNRNCQIPRISSLQPDSDSQKDQIQTKTQQKQQAYSISLPINLSINDIKLRDDRSSSLQTARKLRAEEREKEKETRRKSKTSTIVSQLDQDLDSCITSQQRLQSESNWSNIKLDNLNDKVSGNPGKFGISPVSSITTADSPSGVSTSSFQSYSPTASGTSTTYCSQSHSGSPKTVQSQTKSQLYSECDSILNYSDIGDIEDQLDSDNVLNKTETVSFTLSIQEIKKDPTTIGNSVSNDMLNIKQSNQPKMDQQAQINQTQNLNNINSVDSEIRDPLSLSDLRLRVNELDQILRWEKQKNEKCPSLSGIRLRRVVQDIMNQQVQFSRINTAGTQSHSTEVPIIRVMPGEALQGPQGQSYQRPKTFRNVRRPSKQLCSESGSQQQCLEEPTSSRTLQSQAIAAAQKSNTNSDSQQPVTECQSYQINLQDSHSDSSPGSTQKSSRSGSKTRTISEILSRSQSQTQIVKTNKDNCAQEQGSGCNNNIDNISIPTSSSLRLRASSSQGNLSNNDDIDIQIRAASPVIGNPRDPIHNPGYWTPRPKQRMTNNYAQESQVQLPTALKRKAQSQMSQANNQNLVIDELSSTVQSAACADTLDDFEQEGRSQLLYDADIHSDLPNPDQSLSSREDEIRTAQADQQKDQQQMQNGPREGLASPSPSPVTHFRSPRATPRVRSDRSTMNVLPCYQHRTNACKNDQNNYRPDSGSVTVPAQQVSYTDGVGRSGSRSVQIERMVSQPSSSQQYSECQNQSSKVDTDRIFTLRGSVGNDNAKNQISKLKNLSQVNALSSTSQQNQDAIIATHDDMNLSSRSTSSTTSARKTCGDTTTRNLNQVQRRSSCPITGVKSYQGNGIAVTTASNTKRRYQTSSEIITRTDYNPQQWWSSRQSMSYKPNRIQNPNLEIESGANNESTINTSNNLSQQSSSSGSSQNYATRVTSNSSANEQNVVTTSSVTANSKKGSVLQNFVSSLRGTKQNRNF